jgi:hypothetical protein
LGDILCTEFPIPANPRNIVDTILREVDLTDQEANVCCGHRKPRLQDRPMLVPITREKVPL